jgi:hypothetical protein
MNPPGSLFGLLRKLKSGDKEGVEMLPIQLSHAVIIRSFYTVCTSHKTETYKFPNLVVRSLCQQLLPTHLIFRCFECLYYCNLQRKRYLLNVSKLWPQHT